MFPDIHCPECGASTVRRVDDDGDELRVCPNEDCPRVIVQVMSRNAFRPAPPSRYEEESLQIHADELAAGRDPRD